MVQARVTSLVESPDPLISPGFFHALAATTALPFSHCRHL
jgi:hypothetical protein